jgi:hypothetical protein
MLKFNFSADELQKKKHGIGSRKNCRQCQKYQMPRTRENGDHHSERRKRG